VKQEKSFSPLSEFRQEDEGTIVKVMKAKKAYIARTLWRSEEFQAMTGVKANLAGQIR